MRSPKFSGEIPKNQKSVIICTETNKINFLSQICQDYEVMEVGFGEFERKIEFLMKKTSKNEIFFSFRKGKRK